MTGQPQRSLARRTLRNLLLGPYHFATRSFFKPFGILNKFRAAPYFIRNLTKYSRGNRRPSFRFRLRNLWYRSYDRFSAAGTLTFHYFYQDLWAAQWLFDAGMKEHVDVASRLDGFIAHLLSFCRVTYVDIRPTALNWTNFEFRAGTITDMPFAGNSVSSLSSLHVIEHVGLGRYGDPVDPLGYVHAAEELIRVLKPGGTLLLGTPVGQEALYFDAHRVFDPQTIRDAFRALDLLEFSVINDRNELLRNVSLDAGRPWDHGCGLYVFRKPERTA
jgi:SAM-dependent methyltransferase